MLSVDLHSHRARAIMNESTPLGLIPACIIMTTVKVGCWGSQARSAILASSLLLQRFRTVFY